MELDKVLVNQILQTLPIGYYLKHSLKVQLSETEDGSYINLMNENITISFKQLNKTYTSHHKVLSRKELENDIRCLLYHEVSHALLTPKTLKADSVMNIFEDERIETICKNFYLGVNFKQFVKKLNNFKHEAPTSAMSMFYQIVRYRIGKPELVQKVHELIVRYKYLVSSTQDYYTEMYESDVHDLYKQVEEYFNSLQKQTEEQNNQTEEQNNQTEEQNNQTEEQNNQTEDLAECIDDAVKNFDRHHLLDVRARVNQILLQKKSLDKKNAAAINAYSGVFDTRSVVRQDYRYFLQRNQYGNNKMFAKIHLNLFVDCSGSFRSSEDIVNHLLKVLADVEKTNKDFTFDLISCGYSEKINDRTDRTLSCFGGNLLDDKIFDIFKKVQQPGASNINIVMFDGNAFSDAYSNQALYFSNWKAFDTKNTIIISDNSNEYSITSNIKCAKVIITDDYTQELVKHTLDSLDILMR